MATKISSTASTEKWEAACQILENASDFVKSSVEERSPSLQSPSHFFSTCESLLTDPITDYSTQVYSYVAELLADNVDTDKIWQWLRYRAAVVSNVHEKGAMCIACFEPIPEEPINFENLERLFSLLENPRTAWGVFCAYENEDFPRNIHEHFEWTTGESMALHVPRTNFEKLLTDYLK